MLLCSTAPRRLRSTSCRPAPWCSLESEKKARVIYCIVTADATRAGSSGGTAVLAPVTAVAFVGGRGRVLRNCSSYEHARAGSDIKRLLLMLSRRGACAPGAKEGQSSSKGGGWAFITGPGINMSFMTSLIKIGLISPVSPGDARLVNVPAGPHQRWGEGVAPTQRPHSVAQQATISKGGLRR